MAKKAKKGPKTLFDKVKELDPTFVEEVYMLKNEQLNDKIADMAKQRTLLEVTQSKDEDIKSLKEQLKVANETYTLPVKAIKMKTKLIYKILQERGEVEGEPIVD
jgi:hypothetical protein